MAGVLFSGGDGSSDVAAEALPPLLDGPAGQVRGTHGQHHGAIFMTHGPMTRPSSSTLLIVTARNYPRLSTLLRST